MKILTGIVRVATALFLCYAGSVAADRLLLEDGETRTTVIGEYDCGRSVPLAVDSDNPDLFVTDSADLQRIVDAARAILMFECDRIPEIGIEGYLKGLGGIVFQGIARDDTGWRIAATQSIQTRAETAQSQDTVRAAGGAARQSGDDPAEEIQVVGLSLGMPVADAEAAIAQSFGREPRYDMAEGRMTMEDGGCPPDYDWESDVANPQAGWKCLDAHFTDQRDARLYQLDLIQVLDGTDSDVAVERLIERFGTPMAQWTEPGSRIDQNSSEASYLAWGRAVDVSGRTGRAIHELEVVVKPRGNVLVTVVKLYGPSLRPGWNKPDTVGGGDLRL